MSILFQVAVLKNLPASAGDTRDSSPSLGWEYPLEKEMVTHFSILAWEIPWTEKLGSYSPWGLKEPDTTEQLSMPS